MKLSKAALRSVEAQLGLLAVTYLGAVVLALGVLGLRSVFFERYIREKHAPLPEALRARLADRAEGKAGDPPLTREELGLAYGAWITEDPPDPQGHVARYLHSSDNSFILILIRRTLVAGDRAQRARAVKLLTFTATAEQKPEAIRLGQHAWQRAQRRGEQDLVEQAEVAVRQLGLPAGPSSEASTPEKTPSSSRQ